MAQGVGESRYLKGLVSQEQPQSPKDTESDSQRIVLRQFLQTVKNKGDILAIVDIGSGHGVLAAEMCMVWNDSTAPQYVAVDQPSMLDELNIPAVLHNNSRKYAYPLFLDESVHDYASCSNVFVIRNVIHELNIEETAQLFFTLSTNLHEGCEIYIQDMTNLPVAERGNVGWISSDLRDFLSYCGFEVERFDVNSRGGTTWFCNLAKKIGPTPGQDEILEKCFELRAEQKTKMVESFEEAEKSDDPDAPERIVRIALEISVLERQLSAVREKIEGSATGSEKILDTRHLNVPLTIFPSTESCVSDKSFSGLAELIGIEGATIDKDHIDFTELLRLAKRRYWSVGYSQKPMLTTEQSRSAFASAAERGLDIKLILADPVGPLVEIVEKVRNSKRAGSSPLSHQIQSTIDLSNALSRSLTSNESRQRFQLRLTWEPFAGSYFFVDDTCFFSLYARNMSGSRAPCLIFGKRTARYAGVYEVLEEDFHTLWSDSAPSTGDFNES